MTTTAPDIQRQATRILAEAVRPRAGRAFWGEFVPTLLLVVGTWMLGSRILFPLMANESGWWAFPWLLSCVTLAIWLARSFVIMHDAGHGALAPTGWLNGLIGHTLSLFVLTPMTHWSQLHWHHHRTSGNIEQQDGLGDIFTMTVSRYRSLPAWQRVLYRGFRHRAHFLCVIPFVMFCLFHRLPFLYFPWAAIFRKPKLREILNIALVDACYIVAGWWMWNHWAVAKPWAITYGLSAMMTFTIGVILFYTQHQFENSYYAHEAEWSFFESGVRGSMTLRLPHWTLEWALGYINFHSVHHLKPTIPLYNLPATHAALQQIGVTFSQCRLGDLMGAFRCNLWDEDRQRMVSFAEVD